MMATGTMQEFFSVGKCDCKDPECTSFKVYSARGVTVGSNLAKKPAEAICATLNYMAGADNWHRFHKLVNELRLESITTGLDPVYKKYR